MTPTPEKFISFSLQGKPMGKERVRVNTKTGNVFTPKRTVTYEGRLAYAAQEAMNGMPPAEGPLAVIMDIRVPIPASWPKAKQAAARAHRILPISKPDVDNVNKLLDSCNLIVWQDDAQICNLQTQKTYDTMPGIVIHVSKLIVENDPFV
jgi:Holliday junction resolvase RusA-like endonuclease